MASTPRRCTTKTASRVLNGGMLGRGVLDRVSPALWPCCPVCIDGAVFASIEDSDSEHGDDSSSNTSADDLMSAKRTPCRLQGAGVKEVNAGADAPKVLNVLTV